MNIINKAKISISLKIALLAALSIKVCKFFQKLDK